MQWSREYAVRQPILYIYIYMYIYEHTNIAYGLLPICMESMGPLTGADSRQSLGRQHRDPYDCASPPLASPRDPQVDHGHRR